MFKETKSILEYCDNALSLHDVSCNLMSFVTLSYRINMNLKFTHVIKYNTNNEDLIFLKLCNTKTLWSTLQIVYNIWLFKCCIRFSRKIPTKFLWDHIYNIPIQRQTEFSCIKKHITRQMSFVPSILNRIGCHPKVPPAVWCI